MIRKKKQRRELTKDRSRHIGMRKAPRDARITEVSMPCEMPWDALDER
jgi:hypothetical protein